MKNENPIALVQILTPANGSVHSQKSHSRNDGSIIIENSGISG